MAQSDRATFLMPGWPASPSRFPAYRTPPGTNSPGPSHGPGARQSAFLRRARHSSLKSRTNPLFFDNRLPDVANPAPCGSVTATDPFHAAGHRRRSFSCGPPVRAFFPQCLPRPLPALRQFWATGCAGATDRAGLDPAIPAGLFTAGHAGRALWDAGAIRSLGPLPVKGPLPAGNDEFSWTFALRR